MSTKPSIVPTWATSGPITTPTAAKIAAGFAPAERGAAQYFNYLLNLNGAWASYLNTLLTTGGGAADNIDTSGNANFGGTLGAGGTVTFGGILNVTGLVTGSAGFTSAVNQNFTASGTGKYKRGSRVRKIPANAGQFVGGSIGTGVWQASANAQTITFPLVVDEFERITQVRIKVACGATDVVNVIVYRCDPSTQAIISLGTQASSGHAGATENVTITGLTETVSSSDAFNYIAFCQVTAFAVHPQVYGCELTTDI